MATAATESDLVDLAHNMTAAQLEVVVRAYRRAQPLDADAATARHNKRRVTWTYDDAGMLVGTFCLPPEEGATVVAALDATVTSQDVDSDTGQLAFIRSDGRVVPEIWPPTPVAPMTADGSDRPDVLGVAVADDALRSGWAGDRLPLHDIIANLLWADQAEPAQSPDELAGTQ